MKKAYLFSAIALGGLLTACGGSTEAPEEVAEEVMEEVMEEPTEMNVAIDAANSKVMWKGSMVGMYDHEGLVNITEGNVSMAGHDITGGSFTVDMTSMAATDENFDVEAGKTPDQLVGHLGSPEFFDVENNPTATFTIKEVNGTTATGDLTIKGKTNSETVENIAMSEGDGTHTVTGTLTFNRQDYDVSWAHPVKENVISDDVELNISLVVVGH